VGNDNIVDPGEVGLVWDDKIENFKIIEPMKLLEKIKVSEGSGGTSTSKMETFNNILNDNNNEGFDELENGGKKNWDVESYEIDKGDSGIETYGVDNVIERVETFGVDEGDSGVETYEVDKVDSNVLNTLKDVGENIVDFFRNQTVQETVFDVATMLPILTGVGTVGIGALVIAKFGGKYAFKRMGPAFSRFIMK